MSFVFKPVLEDLAKDATKDWAKDFCKASLRSVFKGRDEWTKAVGRALAEFLLQFEQELIGAGETDVSVKAYTDSLQRFTKLPAVREALGNAVAESGTMVDAMLLAQTWTQQKLERLADDFDWSKLCRRYQNKARAILRESPELRLVLDSQHTQATAESMTRLAGLPPGFDTSKYAEGLRKRYGYLKLESLDPNPDHQRIALTKVFVEQTVRSCQQFNPRVYELPVEHRRKLREHGALETDADLDEVQLKRQRESYLQQMPRPVLEAINDPAQRRCVVLGDPGSGKSVLLEYLSLQWAEHPPAERGGRPIPLLIELKTYADNLAKGTSACFLDYLDHGSGIVSQLDRKELDILLRRGQAMLLLDGLDEIFDQPTRQQVAQDLAAFATRYPDAQLVVTSRIIGYDLVAPLLRDASFKHWMLQELDETQQEQFIQHWHLLAYADATDRAEKTCRLRDSIANSAAIRELAQNPLLITLMALLNRHRELPRDRNELYERASELMLFQWDASRALREDPLLAQQSFDYKDKQAMLRAVAFRMQTEAQGLAGNVIASDDLHRTLVDYLQAQGFTDPRPIAKRLIQQLRERNFILCLLGDDYFAFVHRTFLEFFCAWAWVWKFEKGERDSQTGEIKRIEIEDLRLQTFGAHWRDEKWHEVLRLIAARLEPQFAGILIASLLGRNELDDRYTTAFLAASCFQDVRNPASLALLSKQLEAELKALVEHPMGYRPISEYEAGAKAVHLIALCWPNAATTKAWLSAHAKSDDELIVRRAAVQELARGWKDDPDTLPWLKIRAQQDEDSDVRRTAVQELARGWKDDPDTLPWLKIRAQQDEDSTVRSTAVQELARGWKDDPDTLPILKSRAQQDEDSDVRRTAVQELARGWKDDPDTLPILKSRAQQDDSPVVRRTAVQELARGLKDDPDTLPWLKIRARQDEEPVVRRTAVQELARGWKDDPDTLPILKSRTQQDESPVVRSTAVQELARGWKDDPDTLPILKSRTQQDGASTVRRRALHELARGWKDDPDTLPWLKIRAQQDEAPVVRSTAVQELARGWKDDPDTLPILKSRAQQDESPVVRRMAVQVLARGWQDDPDTLPILKSRAQQDRHCDVRVTAVRQVARCGKDHPGTLSWLTTCAQQGEHDDMRVSAVHEVARRWRNDPSTLPWLKTRGQQDQHWGIRQAAIQELANLWQDDPETNRILKTCIQADKHWAIRRTALQKLARGWKDDPEIPFILKTRAEQDEHCNVRQVAAQEMAHGWKDDPDTLPILKSRAQQDDAPVVRRTAVQELARGWKDDPDTLPILKTRAQQNEDSDVRRTAVQELARGWKDDPGTLPWLKNRAEQDEGSNVRTTAVQELARGWKGDPDTLPWLKTRAQQDEDSDVRRTALQELARGWKDDPDTLPILKTRAQQDQHFRVRQAAVRELARGWKDDPDTLPILKTRAQQDEDSDVRTTAVQELARGWKDDPDTLVISNSRAEQHKHPDVPPEGRPDHAPHS
ncbi:MAG TPA: HEAT repeat domain-containing protein [Planctomycetota bacterium]